MIDLVILVFSGALVGFAVGLTGVGGGSLMTPILLLLGYPPPIAIGTDLLYAAFTKGSGMFFHHRKNNVDWPVMGLLALGSVPVSIAVSALITRSGIEGNGRYESLLTAALGIMLVLTSLVLILQKLIQRRLENGDAPHPHHGFEPPYYGYAQKHTRIMTLVLGMVLGLCVTLTSVGAGAIGAAILFLIYPRWKSTTVVGTDIAHAVPLTLVGGLGYMANGLVDFALLLSLLVGSLPGIYMGTHVGSRFPDRVMRGILIALLMGLGLYFSLLA